MNGQWIATKTWKSLQSLQTSWMIMNFQNVTFNGAIRYTNMTEIQSFVLVRIISKGMWSPRNPELVVHNVPDLIFWRFFMSSSQGTERQIRHKIAAFNVATLPCTFTNGVSGELSVNALRISRIFYVIPIWHYQGMFNINLILRKNPVFGI